MIVNRIQRDIGMQLKLYGGFLSGAVNKLHPKSCITVKEFVL